MSPPQVGSGAAAARHRPHAVALKRAVCARGARSARGGCGGASGRASGATAVAPTAALVGPGPRSRLPAEPLALDAFDALDALAAGAAARVAVRNRPGARPRLSAAASMAI